VYILAIYNGLGKLKSYLRYFKNIIGLYGDLSMRFRCRPARLRWLSSG